MNRTRMLFIGLFALALSGTVTLIVYRQLVSRLNPSVEDPDYIVVAAEKLPLGTRLEVRHLKTSPWAKGVPLEGSFKRPEELVGRGVIVPMLPNEPVLQSKLAPAAGGSGLVAAIPEGMRAVAVKVNEVVGVAGFVLPGSRVDVILSGSPQGKSDIDVSKVFLENVQVLASGQNVEDVEGKPQTVKVITLLVSPDDAQKLALAQIDGQIQLALRNPMDLEKSDPTPTLRAALYRQASSKQEPAPRPAPRRSTRRSKPPAPPVEVKEPPRPAKFEVELLQGAKREVHTFELQPKNEDQKTSETVAKKN